MWEKVVKEVEVVFICDKIFDNFNNVIWEDQQSPFPEINFEIS
jgi:hypothetical protein